MIDRNLEQCKDKLIEAYLEAKIDPCEITLNDYEEAVREMDIAMESCYADLQQEASYYENESSKE